jgi:hypothetical protein
MSIAKICRNSNHLMLLAVIDKTDKQGVNTDVEKLAELGKFFKTHVEYMLDNLLDEGLITIDKSDTRPSKSEQSGASKQDQKLQNDHDSGSSSTITITLPKRKTDVAVHHFSLTPAGQKLLQERKQELGKLSVAMQRLYHTKNMDELYHAIFWNRDWIPFMLYTGVITPDYLKAMLKFLGVDAGRLSMTEMQAAASDLGVGPDYFDLGQVLYWGIHPIISFILSHILMRKLEDRHAEKAKQTKRKNNPDEDMYFPQTG